MLSISDDVDRRLVLRDVKKARQGRRRDADRARAPGRTGLRSLNEVHRIREDEMRDEGVLALRDQVAPFVIAR